VIDYCALCGQTSDEWDEEDPHEHWERCKAGDMFVPAAREGK